MDELYVYLISVVGMRVFCEDSENEIRKTKEE